ncbi:unnamed protein product [Microthlaspi erraticum]|uniref:RING-type E3 ubiquitin transferase n=1 Tax=Microthlaspi erraticum TaxID=1685480 RepID=A0A6D2KBE1_9BRAS|nr:unnamed protein product [Microthlaspi erraticum]CAA7049092.1 unnamed protein product [Microthlaspi erraticum]CAA7049093.1 unnamed protein product [Microthlaspi erraticum]
MEAIPVFTYQIETNPKPQEIGTIVINTNIVGPVDMDLILTRSRFSCSLPTTEFIEDEASPRKKELYDFLIESGVNELVAITLMLKFIQTAVNITSSAEYCPYYALSVWLTLNVVTSSQESLLDDSQFEEAIRASLDDYETNIGFRPASKEGVESLSRRIYKSKPKTSLVADCKSKRRTSSIASHCTICLEEFKSGIMVATFPCGHEFDNKCIVEWCKVSHVCPLCRFKLPCEDGDFSQTTTVF